MKTNLFIYIFTYLFIVSILICNRQCTLHIHFIFDRERIQVSKSQFLPCEMPLSNFVHVDTVSKPKLAITANYIGVYNERTTETRKRCMHVTWQVQFVCTYQLPCVQDVSSHRFSYSNSVRLMSSKKSRILQESCSIKVVFKRVG